MTLDHDAGYGGEVSYPFLTQLGNLKLNCRRRIGSGICLVASPARLGLRSCPGSPDRVSDSRCQKGPLSSVPNAHLQVCCLKLVARRLRLDAQKDRSQLQRPIVGVVDGDCGCATAQLMIGTECPLLFVVLVALVELSHDAKINIFGWCIPRKKG